MNTRVASVLFLSFAVGTIGCPPGPKPPPAEIDAAPGDAEVVDGPPISSDVALACASMRDAGCPDGKPGCEQAIQTTVDLRLTPFDLVCVSGSSTREKIRACKVPKGTCPEPK